MTIVRARQRQNFLIVDQSTALDTRISAEAIRVLVYLLAKPDDWEPCTEEVKKTFGFGINKARRIFRELIEAGYCESHQDGRPGRYGQFRYTIYEQSQLAARHQDHFPEHRNSGPGHRNSAPGHRNSAPEKSPEHRNSAPEEPTDDGGCSAICPAEGRPKAASTGALFPEHRNSGPTKDLLTTTTAPRVRGKEGTAKKASDQEKPETFFQPQLQPQPAGGRERNPVSLEQPGRAVTIPSHWQPDASTLDILEHTHGIPADFALALAPEFLLYWRDRQQRKYSWNSTFLQHAQRCWRKHQKELEYEQQREQQRAVGNGRPGGARDVATRNMLDSANRYLPGDEVRPEPHPDDLF